MSIHFESSLFSTASNITGVISMGATSTDVPDTTVEVDCTDGGGDGTDSSFRACKAINVGVSSIELCSTLKRAETFFL